MKAIRINHVVMYAENGAAVFDAVRESVIYALENKVLVICIHNGIEYRLDPEQIMEAALEAMTASVTNR